MAETGGLAVAGYGGLGSGDDWGAVCGGVGHWYRVRWAAVGRWYGAAVAGGMGWRWSAGNGAWETAHVP